MSESILTFEDVETYYGDSYVLQRVSLGVKPGSIVAVLGRNGMGKTTLIRTAAALTPARSGVIRLRGKSVAGLAPYQIAQEGVALVPQGRRIFRSLSVRENLLLPTSTLARPRKGDWNLEAVLQTFPRLAERLGNGGHQLSGGEQQMLAIGRALMANPELILMDEPSEGLSPVLVQQVASVMRMLRERGHSMLLVEQNFGMAMSVADHVYVISAGRFVFSGTPQQLQDAPDVLAQHLGLGEQADEVL